MNMRTIAKTFSATAILAVSLSACGTAQSSAPASDNAQGGGSASVTHGDPDGRGTRCTIDDVKPSFELSDHGHVNAQLKVVNTSKSDCIMPDEYPTSITFMDREGTPSDGLQVKRGNPATSDVVSLKPGESATADVEWPTSETSPNGPSCNRVWAVQLKMEGDKAKNIEPQGADGGVFDLCGGEATVSAWEKN